MKKVAHLGLAAALMLLGASVAFAKPATAGKGFKALKQEKIQRLERKKQMIQKRLACIKKAESGTEIKECERKYPLKKMNRKKTMAKKMHQKKMSKKEAKKAMKQKMQKKMEKKTQKLAD